jgi:hypothetical protein
MRIAESIAETIDQLDRLHQARRDREAGTFAELQKIVAGLGEPFGPTLEDEMPEPARGRGQADSRRPAAPSDGAAPPFGYELPTRTTHGGEFGSAVRRRLIADALDKGGGW